MSSDVFACDRSLFFGRSNIDLSNMDTSVPAKRKYNKRKSLPATDIDVDSKKKDKDVVKSHIPPEARKILEQWMYDHRFYCYPMKDEKQVLALETGLSIEKVSNWFINSRRRLLPKMLENEGKSSDDFTISRKKSKETGASNKMADQMKGSSTQFDVVDEALLEVYSDDGFVDCGYQPRGNLSTIPETSMEYYDYEEVLVPVTNQQIDRDAEHGMDTIDKKPIQVTRGILYDETTQQKCLFLITY